MSSDVPDCSTQRYKVTVQSYRNRLQAQGSSATWNGLSTTKLETGFSYHRGIGLDHYQMLMIIVRGVAVVPRSTKTLDY